MPETFVEMLIKSLIKLENLISSIICISDCIPCILSYVCIKHVSPKNMLLLIPFSVFQYNMFLSRIFNSN